MDEQTVGQVLCPVRDREGAFERGLPGQLPGRSRLPSARRQGGLQSGGHHGEGFCRQNKGCADEQSQKL